MKSQTFSTTIDVAPPDNGPAGKISVRMPRWRWPCRTLCGLLALVTPWLVQASLQADDGIEFFERKVRPVLVEHCYRCHSAEAKEIKGGLRLDLKAGWQQGGDSGEPAVLPGKPEDSLLLQSMRHAEGVSAMPPKQAKLPDAIIADITTWIKTGAVDPRVGEVVRRDKAGAWEAEFAHRLEWWSLQPVVPVSVPDVSGMWAQNEVDRFILAKLQEQKLSPSPEADRRTLARRLSFALTGLPPDPQQVEQFVNDPAPQAYDALVSQLLQSPQFGERWARHWMDVVHYSDTHGYEWDVPAKNAWRYRDYLIRAFNADLSYQQLVLEQIAGDLLPPRLDQATGINEALIGPMMLRLGERRHGDNSAIEGVTQEAVANMIDTLGKGFLGTTLACAQCHDHKLDAVEQKDYYSLAGMLMSTRFSARPIDTVDPNLAVIEQLRGLKARLKSEISQRWLRATDVEQPGGMLDQLRAIKADEKPAAGFPASIAEFWKRSLATPVMPEEFAQERQRRVAANQANLKLLADFTQDGGANGWRWEGAGMQHGLVRDGELIVADEGDQALLHLLPAGRYSHVWSARMAGALQSPQLDPAQLITFSLEAVSGKFASQSFIVDRALNPERLAFPSRPVPQWNTQIAGNFDSLEGTIDKVPRRVYFELATKELNNYFPPRVGYGGASEAEVADPRSWFGVTKIYQHPPGSPPQDELARFVPLFEGLASETDWARRLTRLVQAAVERWQAGTCSAADVQLLNEALLAKWLPQTLSADAVLDGLVKEYRTKSAELQADRTVGSVAEWNEGRDERLAIRGSYTDLGDLVPRGGVRLLADASPLDASSSGRLRWAQRVVDPRNPLVARVYVNRVWHYLFGAGLVRTTDDFGHLGELPSHPELLDYLAARFVAEGWSTKKLIRLLVSSATWKQHSLPDPAAVEVDPENRLWHHLPLRRLEAEELRDALLAVSGRLDPALFGPAIEPYRTAEDSQKRLFQGPLDGLGRRSIYLEMTLMEPPRFLALFNQPIPKQTVGRRDVTNAPDQALAMLNDPFVTEMARYWSSHLVTDRAQSFEERAAQMLQRALGRPGRPEEIAGLAQFVRRSAELRSVSEGILVHPQVWQDAAHAVFNLKEFLYVR
ncbi:MAG: PSD1 domain-containing protein [Planctomycetes bacterium]|nr:PSD1 domain-containing protein [Planctomycetota bacterium]